MITFVLIPLLSSIHITARSRIPLPQGLLHGLHSSVIHLQRGKDTLFIFKYLEWTKGTSTHLGGHTCALHGTTDASGRVIALHRISSTSAPVARWRHIGLDILQPEFIEKSKISVLFIYPESSRNSRSLVNVKSISKLVEFYLSVCLQICRKLDLLIQMVFHV